MPSQPMMEGGDFEDFKPLGVEDLVFPRFSAFSRAGSRHSRISVLLPEPLTPETTTRRFNGKFTVSPFRLLAAAFWSVSHFNSEVRGSRSERSPESNVVSPRRPPAISDFGFRTCFGF